MKRRQEAQAVYGEVVATTNKELKEMHEEIEKLGEKVNAICVKSENTTFIEAAREKYRKETEEKEELLHIKTDEFYHKSMNGDLVKRGNEEYFKAINEAVADVAKSKKADIVLSKVVSIYNKEKYLPLVLRNVQNQSLRDIEIVCLDDWSTDNCVEVIEKFQKDEPRIVLYKHEKNMGLVTTRAHLGQYAKGKYLMLPDPDDAYCSPDAAKMTYEKAEITGADIIHFKSLIDEPNEISIKFVPHSYCIDNSFFY